MTEFENQIRRAALRSLPSEWREDILAAARPCRRPRRTAFLVSFRNPISALRNLLWPHPAAWAVLAACWIVAAALCLSGPRGAELYAVTPPGFPRLEVSPELYAAYLKTRDRLLSAPAEAEPQSINRRKL